MCQDFIGQFEVVQVNYETWVASCQDFIHWTEGQNSLLIGVPTTFSDLTAVEEALIKLKVSPLHVSKFFF